MTEGHVPTLQSGRGGQEAGEGLLWLPEALLPCTPLVFHHSQGPLPRTARWVTRRQTFSI